MPPASPDISANQIPSTELIFNQSSGMLSKDDQNPTSQQQPTINENEEREDQQQTPANPISEEQEKETTTKHTGQQSDIYMNRDQDELQSEPAKPTGSADEDSYIWMEGDDREGGATTGKESTAKTVKQRANKEVKRKPDKSKVTGSKAKNVKQRANKDKRKVTGSKATEIETEKSCSCSYLAKKCGQEPTHLCQPTSSYYNIVASTAATAEHQAEVVHDNATTSGTNLENSYHEYSYPATFKETDNVPAEYSKVEVEEVHQATPLYYNITALTKGGTVQQVEKVVYECVTTSGSKERAVQEHDVSDTAVHYVNIHRDAKQLVTTSTEAQPHTPVMSTSAKMLWQWLETGK